MGYLAETYKRIVAQNEDNVFREKAVPLPKPELYVIYTGPDPHDETELSLADIHWNGDNAFVDVKVRVLYGRPGTGIIYEYAEFSRICRERLNDPTDNRSSRERLSEAIDICIGNNILREYLLKRKDEVMEIMDMLFNQEVVTDFFIRNERKDAQAEGRAEGLAEGAARQREAAAKAISERFNISYEEALAMVPSIPLSQK
ncbi:MAG: PPE family protein [Clostridia bacterium]|nr:PPE family protein [Clostridia bacterium]